MKKMILMAAIALMAVCVPAGAQQVKNMKTDVQGDQVVEALAKEYKGEVVLVDFWATWCGPCRMLAPVIAEIADAHEGVLKVGKVNVDEQPELATAYRVESIPTVFLFRNGEIAAKAVGFRSRADLESLLGL